ncbi:cytochrome P450 [Mycena maculata]|uniref:Cytochrome P450 n=1 Tax=Mycena maculata TaxID=230809 RepID=A0AAD7K8A2_9AGAR|nr:cytochrome P450 [Mycena maculata]
MAFSLSLLTVTPTSKTLGPLVLLGIILIAGVRRSYKYAYKGKLPPGPPGLPVVGNLLQIPKDRAWLVFTEWRKKYGDIFYLNLAGQNVVVLGNYKVAADLLDRRASQYSDRPRNIVAGELLTGGLVFAFAQHNDVWKRMRRGSHEALNNQVARNYFGFQETESVLLVDQFLRDPSEWDNHLRRASTSLVLSIIYGLPPLLDSKDPDILRVNHFTARALHAAAPGAFLVEYFTWMEHLPRFMSPWRRYAENWFRADSILFEKLFSRVKDRVDSGDETSSVASTLIHDQEKLNLSSHESAWVSATLYAAGAETTSGQLAWFIMAMILYPETQKKAQEEIDRVVGRDRLPVFRDHGNLPYVRALVKETMRWRGVAPLGVPRRLAQDDYYEGHFLPKDTICIVNVWHLNHDPEVYGPNADEFVPERHLDSEGRLQPAFPDTKDESHHTYGFGRRICVGRYVSNNSMFIEIASLLWSFNIGAGRNQEGNIVLPDPMDTIDDGLIVRPAPFPCSITPRNSEVESVIAQTKELHS